MGEAARTASFANPSRVDPGRTVSFALRPLLQPPIGKDAAKPRAVQLLSYCNMHYDALFVWVREVPYGRQR